MQTTISDGRSIDRYIPSHLRNMFYRNSTPSMKYARHNGLDPYGFSTNGLVLYLPLWALKDSAFKSVDAYKRTTAVAGATWTPLGRDLSGDDQFLEIAADSSTELNFTTGACSGMVWVKPDTDDDSHILLNKGAVNVNGWWFELAGDATFVFRTSQDGANQAAVSLAAGYVKDVWNCLGFTSDAVNPLLYKSGVDNTTGVPAHTAPDSAATNKFLIGITDDETSRDVDGTIGEVWVWSRELSAGEMLHNYSCTKWRYQ